MSDLIEIISKGEGEQLEFSSQIDDWYKTAKILVAFANSDGGKLLIGIKDNSKIIGVSPGEMIKTINEISNSYCKPPVEFLSKTWKVKHHLVLEINVLKSKDKHRALDKEKSWKFYIRSGNQIFRGNKILENVWNLEKFGSKDLELVDDSEKSILKIIEEGQLVTLSQIYKTSNRMRSEVDKILSLLVFMNQVIMKTTENGTFYSLSQN